MAKKEAVITTDEWLDELERMKRPSEIPEGYATCNVIATRCGVSTTSARGRLRNGRLDKTIRAVECVIDSHVCWTYSLEDLVKSGGM